jgi:hypothetical protein
MKITRNFQLALFISMLGIPFLGQAAQVAPTPAVTPSSLDNQIKQLNNSITTIINKLVQIQQAMDKTSSVVERSQLFDKRGALWNQLNEAKAILTPPPPPQPKPTPQPPSPGLTQAQQLDILLKRLTPKGGPSRLPGRPITPMEAAHM